MRLAHLPGVCAILFSSACGGKPPPSAEPPAASEPTKAAASEAPAPEPEAKPEAPAETPDQPGSSATKPTRSPIDTLTAAKMAFVINFSSSAFGEATEEKCDRAAKDDPKKRAACIQKERASFNADVLQFKKDDKDKYWFIIYKRKGSALTVLSRSEVQFSDEKDNSVALNVVGKDKAPRVLFTHKNKFVVTVPNDYSIELEDPRYKKLVYDAKIDIVE